MTDVTTLQLKLKQAQAMKAKAALVASPQAQAAAGRSGQPTEGNAITRVGQAAYEGLKAPFQTPLEGPSPDVQSFIDQSPGPLKPVNQFLLGTVPQVVQGGMRVATAPVSAVAGAIGGIGEEFGGPPAADTAAAMREYAGAVGAHLGMEGAAVQTPVKVPQLIGASKNLEAGAAEASQVLRDQGVSMPVQKLTTSAAMDMLSNTAETSILGGGKMRSTSAASEAAARNAVDGLASDITNGMSKEHVGEVLKTVIEDKADAFRAAAKGAYKAVDDAMAKDGAAGPMVDIRALKARAASIQQEVQAGVDPTGAAFLNNISAKGDFVTFNDAQILRSDLLGIGRNMTEVIPGRSQVYGKRLSPEMDKAMESAALSMGPNALEAWRSANELWKGGKETFNSKIMKGIANNDADTIYQSVVKNGRPINIRRVREMVGPQNWKNVQGQFVQDMVSKATDGTDLSGSKLMASIKSFEQGGIYKEVLNDPAVADRWKVLARTLELTQKGNATNAMKLKTTLTSGALPELYAVYQIAHGNGSVLNGAILLGPTILSRIMTSPRLARWMTDGVGNPSGSIRGANASRNLISALVANGLVDPKQNPTDNLKKLNAAQAAANIKHNIATTGPRVPIGP